MNKQFKSKSELFYYLMHGYMYMLEDVPTKNGIQKRLKDNELEQSLKEQIKEQLKIDGLEVELKLGLLIIERRTLGFSYLHQKIEAELKEDMLGFHLKEKKMKLNYGLASVGRQRNNQRY